MVSPVVVGSSTSVTCALRVMEQKRTSTKVVWVD